MLFTLTLVLHRDEFTLNDVTSRSPTNSAFTVQVHGRPIFFISTETKDPDFTDPSQLLIDLIAAENIRTMSNNSHIKQVT